MYRWVGRNVWNWSAGSCHYRGYTSYGHVIIERHWTSVFLRHSLGSEHLFCGRSRLISKSWIRINSYLDWCPCDGMDIDVLMHSWCVSGRSCCLCCSAIETAADLLWKESWAEGLFGLSGYTAAGSTVWQNWIRMWIPLPAAGRPSLKAPSLLQSEVQTWTLWVCVALGLFTVPGWGPCYSSSATMFLWEVPLCFNGIFRRWNQRGELWVASASASVTSSSEGLLGWRIPSRYNTNHLYLAEFISSAEMRS